MKTATEEEVVQMEGITITKVGSVYYNAGSHSVVDERKLDGQNVVYICRSCNFRHQALSNLVRQNCRPAAQ